MSDHSIGFLLYDVPEQQLLKRFSEGFSKIRRPKQQIILSQARTKKTKNNDIIIL